MSKSDSRVRYHADVCKINIWFYKRLFKRLAYPELKNLLRSLCRNDFTLCSGVGGLFKSSFTDLQSQFQGCLGVTLYFIFSKASDWTKWNLAHRRCDSLTSATKPSHTCVDQKWLRKQNYSQKVNQKTLIYFCQIFMLIKFALNQITTREKAQSLPQLCVCVCVSRETHLIEFSSAEGFLVFNRS